jgi:cytochrome c
MFKSVKTRFLSGVLASGLACKAGAQNPTSFKYESCADVSQSSFTKVTIMNRDKAPGLEEPVRFSVAGDGRVFFGERNGTVRVIQKDGSIVTLGRISVQDIHSPLGRFGSNEYGLDGLILDRNFEATGWIYIYYQANSATVSKLSRFKVSGTTLDPASEQNLLTWPYQRDYCCHTGGGMEFDSKGDLWLAVGNNTKNPTTEANGYVNEAEESSDDQAHAANTNDLRGKILRIHPLAAPGPDGKLFSIPAGNLKEAYASLWTAADLAKVRPEIYTMGHRSNWSIAVDTLKNLLMWGDIGPDDGWETEEYNLTSKPGNFGWPYFAGAEGNAHYRYRLGKDPKAPMNTSRWNTGAQKLPPAMGAILAYGQSAAIVGPIYRWSSGQPSPKRLPPHFDGKWFLSDFNAGYLHVATLDDAATRVAERKGLANGLVRPVQVSIGPDGILYTLEYAAGYFMTDGHTQIKRWEYTGPACQGPVSARVPENADGTRRATWTAVAPVAGGSVSIPEGATGLRLYDVQGRLAWAADFPAGLAGSSRVDIPVALGNGVFRAAFRF